MPASRSHRSNRLYIERSIRTGKTSIRRDEYPQPPDPDYAPTSRESHEVPALPNLGNCHYDADETHLLPYNHRQLLLCFQDIVNHTIKHYRLLKSSGGQPNDAQVLVDFLSGISREKIQIRLQGKDKWLPLSGFVNSPRYILTVAQHCHIDNYFPSLYEKLQTCVARMNRDYARFRDDGEAVLRYEARLHLGARRDVYAKLKRLDEMLDTKAHHSNEDLDHLVQLANTYHRLQHAIAIIKEIAHGNGLHPDTIFLQNDSLRVGTDGFTAEDFNELQEIALEFVLQEQFEIAFDTGLVRRFVAETNGAILAGDDVLAEDVLPAQVGDLYADTTLEARQIIIEHFNTIRIPLGVLGDILSMNGRRLPEMIHQMYDPWNPEI